MERNIRNSGRQEDAHYAQSSRIIIIHNQTCSLMYGSETWALRKAQRNLLERTETRMLRRMMVIRTIEKIRNEDIREERLRRLGHVEGKTGEDVVMRTWEMEVVDSER